MSLAVHNSNMVIKLEAGNTENIDLKSNKIQISIFPAIPKINQVIMKELTLNGYSDGRCVWLSLYLAF